MKTPCYQCKRTIIRPFCHVNRASKSFCNQKCYARYKVHAAKRGDDPNWQGKLKFTCKGCGKKCEMMNHYSDRNDKRQPKYCSIKCAAKGGAQGLKGEKHWNWQDGKDLRYWRKNAPRPMPENCEICEVPGIKFKKGLCYDHNHKTGKFRGWLCSNCNSSLGLTMENPIILKALIKYLKINEKSSLIDSNAEMPTRRKALATVND